MCRPQLWLNDGSGVRGEAVWQVLRLRSSQSAASDFAQDDNLGCAE
jgi:hypothetical protein